MYAGAARVVASLWKVDDAATAELMKHFYTYMLEQKLPASEALRRAQLDISSKEEWRASFYWAGFVLQGEWK
jgi:CHAT domain-containing protein